MKIGTVGKIPIDIKFWAIFWLGLGLIISIGIIIVFLQSIF